MPYSVCLSFSFLLHGQTIVIVSLPTQLTNFELQQLQKFNF
jgi:hypothetical protein